MKYWEKEPEFQCPNCGKLQLWRLKMDSVAEDAVNSLEAFGLKSSNYFCVHCEQLFLIHDDARLPKAMEEILRSGKDEWPDKNGPL